MFSWIDALIAGVLSNTVAVIVKSVYDHWHHQEEVELLKEIRDLLSNKEKG